MFQRDDAHIAARSQCVLVPSQLQPPLSTTMASRHEHSPSGPPVKFDERYPILHTRFLATSSPVKHVKQSRQQQARAARQVSAAKLNNVYVVNDGSSPKQMVNSPYQRPVRRPVPAPMDMDGQRDILFRYASFPRPRGPPPPYEAHHHTTTIANPTATHYCACDATATPTTAMTKIAAVSNKAAAEYDNGVRASSHTSSESSSSSSSSHGHYPLNGLTPRSRIPLPQNGSPAVHKHDHHHHYVQQFLQNNQPSPVYSPPVRRQVPANLDMDGPREIIDATGSVPTSTFSSPEKRSATSDFVAILGRPRSSSEHALSAILSEAQQQSLGYAPPVKKPPPEKPPRSSASRPWSQLVTEREVQHLEAYKDIFTSPTGPPADSPQVRYDRRQKSDTDVAQAAANAALAELLKRRKAANVVTERANALHDAPEVESHSDVDSMMQKFKKSFSLRFTRFGSTRSDGIKAKLRYSTRAKSVDSRAGRDIPIRTVLRETNSEERSSSPTDDEAKDKTTISRSDTGLQEVQLREKTMSVFERRRSRRGLRRSLSQPQNIEKLDEKRANGLSESSNSLVRSSSEIADADTLQQLRPRPEAAVSDSQDELSNDLIYVEAVFDHIVGDSLEDDELLAFRAGDVIEVTDSSDKEWWWGSCNDR